MGDGWSRLAAVAAAAALAAGSLAACSGGDDYCAALAAEQPRLEKLAAQAGSPGTDVITPTLAAFERLRAAAPVELADEWETVVLAWQALADAVARIGIDPAEFRADDLPEGVTRAQADEVAAVASKLDSARVREAVAGIDDQASQVCDVDFSA